MAMPKLMKVLDTDPIWNNVELVTALVRSSDYTTEFNELVGIL